MAYSDYGAFVWKNGKEITEECADVAFWDGKGHAVLDLGTHFLVFDKDYNPYLYDKEAHERVVLNLDEHGQMEAQINKKTFTIYESNYDYLKFREFSFDGNDYFVVCGCGVGHGFEKTHVSKIIKKYLDYLNIKLNDGVGYFFYGRGYLMPHMDLAINWAARHDDIIFERHLRNAYIKDLLANLFSLRFNNVLYDWIEICKRNLKIKYLK